MKENSVHVTDINCSNKKKVVYNTITYIGNRLQIKSKALKLNDELRPVKLVDIQRTKKNFFAVTTNVRDILAAYPDAIIIPSSSRYKGKTHDVSHHDNNGVVLLYYAIISKTPSTYEMKFDHEFAQKIKKVKENTIKKGADHNGSTGLYYSFGNKGAMCENEQR